MHAFCMFYLYVSPGQAVGLNPSIGYVFLDFISENAPKYNVFQTSKSTPSIRGVPTQAILGLLHFLEA